MDTSEIQAQRIELLQQRVALALALVDMQGARIVARGINTILRQQEVLDEYAHQSILCAVAREGALASFIEQGRTLATAVALDSSTPAEAFVNLLTEYTRPRIAELRAVELHSHMRWQTVGQLQAVHCCYARMIGKMIDNGVSVNTLSVGELTHLITEAQTLIGMSTLSNW